MFKCLLFVVIATVATMAQAQDKACALVILHGKWGSPQTMSLFASRLDPPCANKVLEMPWAQRRSYDEPYAVALAAIGAQVAAFRAQGFGKVLVAGQSFGANAVVAYLAEGGDADAAVVLAPGHTPKSWYERGTSKEAVDKAREMVAAGKGRDTLSITDINQGERRSMSMRADVMLSYFEPEGLGDIPTSAARVKRALPVLWVTPIGDSAQLRPSYGFEQLPPNSKSKFTQVQSGHMSVPDASVGIVQEWLKAVVLP